MIYNQDFYTEFISGILKRVPLLRSKQLTNALMNIDNEMTPELAWAVLYNIERCNHVLFSEGGWAMTLGMYRTLTHDKYLNGVDVKAEFKIQDRLAIYGNNGREPYKYATPDELIAEMPNGNKRLSILNSMWVVTDMLPASDEFVTDTGIWDVSFVTHPSEESGKYPKLYEIIYISEKRENLICKQLSEMKMIDDKELQKPIMRIAILDNPEHAFKVPYIGFSHILTLDPDAKSGYYVVEKRPLEERWSGKNGL